jgi:hypothetical protein
VPAAHDVDTDDGHAVETAVVDVMPVVDDAANVPAAQTVQVMSLEAVAATAKNVPAGHCVETAALSAAAPEQ